MLLWSLPPSRRTLDIFGLHLSSVCRLSLACRNSWKTWGRVANPRPVAAIKTLATGHVVQRQVLRRTVGHGESGFLGRSSDLDRSSGNGVRVYETGLGFATRSWCIGFTRQMQSALSLPATSVIQVRYSDRSAVCLCLSTITLQR